MKGIFRTVMLLVGLSSGLYGGSAYALDVQVSGGLVTLGSAEISSDSTDASFGYTLDGYSGAQLGATLILDDGSSVMMSFRELSGKANSNLTGLDFGDMKRTDTTITYSRDLGDGYAGYVGWKTGSSHVAVGGIDYFNFSSSGPLVGATSMHKFSSEVVGNFDASFQYISDGTYKGNPSLNEDQATSAYGFGFGLGLVYLVNKSFSVGGDYKYSLNTFNFDTTQTVSDVNEKISHIELTAKYKF